MLSKVKSCGIAGIDGYVVDIQTDISSGIPTFDIVGLGDTAVRESRERVRAAIKNSGFEFPTRRITINLAPANIKKEGSAYDLGIAIGILLSTSQIQIDDIDSFMFAGELSLDGRINPVRGVLSMAACARQAGITGIFVPAENADEAAVVKGIDVFPAETLCQLAEHFCTARKIKKHTVDIDGAFKKSTVFDIDFEDVKGQENVKRAMEVAAAGAHNILMIGSPGSGKTMMARRLQTILPPLTFEEALEVTKIHSVAGLLPQGASLVTARPFRAPHHTISQHALVGGGSIPKPGEISLAHKGVLFLDEMPEFSKSALEVLRQPVEDGVVTISRVNSTVRYPSDTTLICAANPCKCGNYMDPGKECTCTPAQIRNYLERLSGPLLDRIDIHVEVPSIRYEDLQTTRKAESSRSIRKRVAEARKLQIERYRKYNIFSNSQLTSGLIKKFCRLDDKGQILLKDAFEKLGLSARAYNKILKVSRTIADLDMSEDIRHYHVAEAIQYRSLDRGFFRG